MVDQSRRNYPPKQRAPFPSAADGSAGVAARFWPKKASIAVYHHSAYCMLPLLLVCCVCLCRRVWSAVLLCCRVVCCVKGKRRVSTEMGRRYLPRGQGMFCLDDAKRLDRHPWQLDVNRHLGCGIIGIFHVHGLYIQIIPSMCGNEILRSILLCDLALSSRCPPSENIAGTRTLAHHTLPGISCCVGSVGLDHCC